MHTALFLYFLLGDWGCRGWVAVTNNLIIVGFIEKATTVTIWKEVGKAVCLSPRRMFWAEGVAVRWPKGRNLYGPFKE